MGNKLTGIICGMILVGTTSPLWLRDILTDTRRVKLDDDREVAVSKWIDDSRTELYTGAVAGICLTDSNNDGSVDSRYDFCVAPRGYPIRINREVTDKNRELYEETVRKFNSGKPTGFRGIYSSIIKIFSP